MDQSWLTISRSGIDWVVSRGPIVLNWTRYMASCIFIVTLCWILIYRLGTVRDEEKESEIVVIIKWAKAVLSLGVCFMKGFHVAFSESSGPGGTHTADKTEPPCQSEPHRQQLCPQLTVWLACCSPLWPYKHGPLSRLTVGTAPVVHFSILAKWVGTVHERG